jgi:hypothetical protein
MRVKVQYNADGEKKCTKCNEFKDVSNFHKWSKGQDGLKLFCKPCVREYDLKEDDSKRKLPRKYLENKMHCRECNKYLTKDNFTIRKYTNARCDECQIIYQHKRTVKKHGITYEQYLDMYAEQDGKCKICLSVEKSYKSRLSIDHDHSCCPGSGSCGKCIRGLLCSNCNTFLGNAKDSIEILQAAIKYLQK